MAQRIAYGGLVALTLLGLACVATLVLGIVVLYVGAVIRGGRRGSPSGSTSVSGGGWT